MSMDSLARVRHFGSRGWLNGVDLGERRRNKKVLLFRLDASPHLFTVSRWSRPSEVCE